MRQIAAFIKKEWMELIRTGKGILLLILFMIFGIMNPAIAKLTPWLFEMLGDTLAEQGMVIQEIKIDAMTSWQQYYKNLSMELFVIVILFCGILTREYQKGTLINMLTKGLLRWKVIIAKGITMFLVWTICYYLCFGITYGYNAYFWDNSIASHVWFGGFNSYLFGLWMLSIILAGSVLVNSGYVSLLITLGLYALTSMLSMIPVLEQYLPSRLSSGYGLLSGMYQVADFIPAVGITLGLIVLNIIVSIVGFNRKRL